MPYSASEMFVSYGIPSFYELLHKFIFDFSEPISKNTNSITEACLSPKVYIFLTLDNGGLQYYFKGVLYPEMPEIYFFFIIKIFL